MKSSKSSRLLIFSLSALAFFYVSCQKNGGVDPNSPLANQQRHKDSLKAFIQPAFNLYWRNAYNKQGSAVLKPDTCNKFTTYHLTTANLNSEGSEGYVFIDYNNSPCIISGMLDRSKQPQNITYSFTVNPNTLYIPDNGYDLKHVAYNVLKLTADSMILQSQQTPSFFKVYLPSK